MQDCLRVCEHTFHVGSNHTPDGADNTPMGCRSYSLSDVATLRAVENAQGVNLFIGSANLCKLGV